MERSLGNLVMGPNFGLDEHVGWIIRRKEDIHHQAVESGVVTIGIVFSCADHPAKTAPEEGEWVSSC